MLLRIYNQDHNFIGYVRKIRDLCITSSVEDGSEELSFTYLAQHHTLDVEFYLLYDENEYVIKQMQESSDGFPVFTAVLNKEELWAKDYKSFSVKDSTIYDAARLACTSTGWRVYEPDADSSEYISKKRNAGMLDVKNADDVLQKLCTAFMLEIRYDCKNKVAYFYEKRGSDRGVYLKDGLNLRKLKRARDTYDLYTRIRPVGSNNLSITKVNDGLEYLEDKTYSNKNRTYVWEASDYTDARALMDDAKLMLEDLSRPVDSYEVDIVDLAAQNPTYGILSFGLGDTVKMIDSRTGIATKQRIMKLTRYPNNPEKNKAEIASPVLRFTDLSEKYRSAYEIINTVVANDGRYTGTINVSDILHFEDGISGSATVGSLTGKIEEALAEIGTLKVNKISAEEADLKYATIENLTVTSEKVGTIEGDYASFKSTVTDELAAHSGQIDDLQVAKGWMLDASIGDAQIANVSANKLTAGTIDTAIVTVQGSDGRLVIQDNTIAIRDANRVRVQVGRDGSGDYTLAVWDAEGKLIWDALGATENSIQRPIIRDAMVSEDAAISGNKLDIASVVTAVNNGTTSISTTVIKSGNKSLDVILREQTQTVADYGEQLSTAEARLEATERGLESKVSSSTYTADQKKLNSSLQVVESDLKQTQSSMSLLISKTEITKIQDFLSIEDGSLLGSDWYETERTVSDTFTIQLSKPLEAGKWYTLAFQCISGDLDSAEIWDIGDDTIIFQLDSESDRWYASINPTEEISEITVHMDPDGVTIGCVVLKQGIPADYTAIKDLIGAEVGTRTSALRTELTADLDGIRQRLESTETDLGDLDVWKTEVSSTLTRDGIVNIVGSYYTTADNVQETLKNESKTIMEQTNQRFSWLIKSGTNETDFELTDRAAMLATQKFTVTDSTGATVIEGGKVNLDQLFANDITATGTIKGLHLEGATGTFGAFTATAQTTSVITDGAVILLNGDWYKTNGSGGILIGTKSGSYTGNDYLGESGSYVKLTNGMTKTASGWAYSATGTEIWIKSNWAIRNLCRTIFSEKSTDGATNYGDILETYGSVRFCDTSGNKTLTVNGTEVRTPLAFFCKTSTQTSDRRLKGHICYMSDTQEQYVQQLEEFRPAVYTFKGEDIRRYGLYAQDVRDAVLNNGVTPYGIVSALREDGTTGDLTTPPEGCTYGMDYMETIPLLINGWQSHHSRIRELENRVTDLQLQLDAAYTEIAELQDNLTQYTA